jgi:hypothetical protein
LKWERAFDAVLKRMTRQKQAIDRMLLLNMELSAALYEIAEMYPDRDSENGGDASVRAQEALDKMKEPAAAATKAEAEELASAPIPTNYEEAASESDD